MEESGVEFTDEQLEGVSGGSRPRSRILLRELRHEEVAPGLMRRERKRARRRGLAMRSGRLRGSGKAYLYPL